MTACAGHHRVPAHADDDWQPPEGEPVFCRWHNDAILAALRRLPEAFVWLHTQAVSATPSKGTDIVTGSRERRSPAPYIDDIDEVCRWAFDWEDTWRRLLRDAAAPQLPLPRTRNLLAATGYLTANYDRCCKAAEDLAAEYGHEVLDTLRRLDRRVGTDRLVHRLPAPCPVCDMRSLVRPDGSDTVSCTNTECGERWASDDYDRLVLVLASEAKGSA